MRRPLIQGIVTALTAMALTLVLVAPVRAASPPSLIKDINPYGNSYPTRLTQVGNVLFFAADDGVHGRELWKSDGTAAGTRMVKNIRPYGKSSSPSDLVNVNGMLFFMANDGKHGNELWKSDGTKTGTVMVRDLHAGPSGQFDGNSTILHGPPIAVGSRLFFIADTGDFGSTLYVSDGTSVGTKAVSDARFFPPEEAFEGTAGGKFYFVTLDANGGAWDISHLWVSDGTTTGTHRVAGSPTAKEVSILPNNGSNVYFDAGGRLWRTDGTKAGTKPLTTSGELRMTPTESVLMGKRLYFGESGMIGGLWRTDGTATGTKEISGSPVLFLIATGGQLYFSAHGALLTSDGTAAGTHELAYFDGGWLHHLVAVGDKVCFFAPNYDFGTWTLGESDGTTNGTYAVKSFVYSDATDTPGASVGGRFFFAADDGVHGAELWSYTP